MAKMFYSIEEAAQRLGKSAEQVKEMAASGQLQEFRDRDRLMFKREQVDLLAGDAGGDSAVIPLADSRGGSGMGLALEDSGPLPPGKAAERAKSGSGGSGMGIEVDEPTKDAPNQRSGISIFDTEPDDADPLAATRITDATRAGPELQMESVGSGSGLLDLTREADDTSLGADLLEDVYKPDEGQGDTTGASGLFESTAAPSDVSAAAAAAGAGVAMVAAEPFEPAWSGLAGGVALGVALVSLVLLFAVLTGLMGAGDNELVKMLSGNFMAALGGMAGVVAICGGVGFFVGKR